jgi:hypothetical protein
MRRPSLRNALILSCLALTAALLAAPVAQAASPLIAQWPFETTEQAGDYNLTPDVSGNELALGVAGAINLGTAGGKFGSYLDGSTARAPEVESPLLAPQRLTLLAWIKEDGDPGTLRYIAGRGDDGGGSCGGGSYALYTGYPGNGGLHFYIRTPGPTGPPVLSEAAPDAAVFDGHWHLVAGTFDGTNMRFFVDGNEIGQPMPAPAISYEAPLTGSNFYVDGYAPDTGCPDNSDFPGAIDEVRVYDRALSQTELARLAAAPGPEAPALVPDGEGGSGDEPPPGGGGTVGGAPPAGGGTVGKPIGPTPVPVGLTLKSPNKQFNSWAVLEVQATGSVEQTNVKVDGKPAFSVGQDAPYVALNLGSPGTHTVTATTTGMAGEQVTRSTSILFKPPATGVIRPPGAPDTAVTSSNIDLILEGARNNSCAPDSTVIFGVVEAQGCFSQINTVDELPRSEQAVTENYYAATVVTEALVLPVHCIYGELACVQNANAVLQHDPAAKPFMTNKAMHVDGMTVTPVGGASIVVFPALNRIVSSNAKITYDGSVFGSIPVQSGPLNLDVRSGATLFSNGDERLQLFSFDTSQAFDDIGGFPINGTVGVYFQKKGDYRSTSLKVNLSLPDAISTAAGADPTAKVEVNADNTRGTYLGLLNIHMNEAFLGPIELANVDFTYNDAGEPRQECPRKWWKATAEVFFLPGEGEGAGLKLAPEPQRNGIAFCAGSFHSAGADLKFGAPIPPPEIFPGVTLNEIGFSFQLDKPVVFDGFAKLKAAEIVTATGGFLAAFATHDHPYTVSAADAGGALPELKGQTFNSTTIALGGKVDIEPFEEIEVELGSAYLLYSYPGYIAAKGSAHMQTFLFTVNATGSLELSTVTDKFNALVEGEVCLAGGIKIAHIGACASGEARVSSRGLSICFNVLDGTWTPGAGYRYGDTFPEFFLGTFGDGCKPSEFWETTDAVRGITQSATTTIADTRARRLDGFSPDLNFTVKKGETAKDLELVGSGGAPALTVVAPDGEELATEPGVMLHGKHLSVMAANQYKRTWIGVEDAVPGVYKVILQAGSPGVSDVRATREEPNAGVEASVTGTGRHLVLHYDAGHAKGQSVSFFERGKGAWELLKKVDGGKGQVAFEPSYGPAGRRSVAAQVEVNDIPSKLQTLAHFKAPPPPLATRVGQVAVVRHGTKLLVSWAKAPYAQAYSVVTEARGGVVHERRLKPKRTSLTVKGVPATEGGRVEVVAFGPLGDRGKPGRAKFAALRKPHSRLLPYKELGAHAAGAKGKPGGKA